MKYFLQKKYVYYVKNIHMWSVLCIIFPAIIAFQCLVNIQNNRVLNFFGLLLIAAVACSSIFFRSISKKRLGDYAIVIIVFPLLICLICIISWIKKDMYIEELVRVFMILIFAFSYWQYPINKQGRIFWNIFLVFTIIYGLMQILFGDYVQVGINKRLKGFLVHPNAFGLMCVMSGAICYEQYKYYKNLIYLFMGFLFLILYTQVFNGGAMIFLMSYIILKIVIKYGVGGFIIGALLCVALVSMFYISSPRLKIRMDDIVVHGLMPKKDYPETSFQWRIFMWQYLFQKAMLTPFSGKGPGSSKIMQNTDLGKFRAADPHNEAMRIFYEYGIVGLIAVFLMIVVFLKKTVSVNSKIIIISFIMSSMFDNFFRISVTVVLVLYYARLMEYYEMNMFADKKENMLKNIAACHNVPL